MKPFLKVWFKFFFALVFTGFLLYWCLQQVDLKTFLGSLRQSHPHFLILAVTCTVSILFLNSFQMKLYLPTYSMVPYWKMFQLVAVFSMTVNVIPFWGGHALFIYLLGQKEKVGKTVALSVLTMEQIIAGFGKIFLFAVVAFTSPLPSWMKEGVKGFLALVALVFSALWILSFRFKGPLHETKYPPNFRGRLQRLVVRWAHHLHALRDLKKFIATVTNDILMKLMEVLAIFFIQKSLGLDLGLSAAFLVAASLSLATTLPLTPGRIGVFEAAAMLTYEYLGVDSSQAFAVGVLIHAAHTLPFIVAGYFSALKMGFKRPFSPSGGWLGDNIEDVAQSHDSRNISPGPLARLSPSADAVPHLE